MRKPLFPQEEARFNGHQVVMRRSKGERYVLTGRRRNQRISRAMRIALMWLAGKGPPSLECGL